MNADRLRALSAIACAEALLSACRGAVVLEGVSLSGIAAKCREAARLAMKAAHRLDPRTEEADAEPLKEIFR